MMPVRDTPRSLSLDVLVVHILRRYGNLTKVACIVPKIVAMRTLRSISFRLSVARITASVKLHTCPDNKIISEQGFVPNSSSDLRLPFLAAWFLAA